MNKTQDNLVQYKPIGIINTPFKTSKGTPIQPKKGKGIKATVEIYEEYVPALDDLDGFSHIILIYHLHLSKGYKLKVVPFLDTEQRGLFATRAPRRPNPIGISVVQLDKIEGSTLFISNIDIVKGTPLLDIKPYVPHFDEEQAISIGWLEKRLKNSENKRADDRFVDQD